MASTDTIVGIVGAVLLAGLMVTVFVYEYNNVPDDTPDDPDAAARDAFAAAHPLLEADEDIDGDGMPNYKDSDLDGNAQNDTAQTGELRYSKSISGTSPGPPATTHTQTFVVFVATGNQGLNATIGWTASVPLPQVPTAPNFTCRLLRGTEVEAACTAGTATGGERILTLKTDPDLATGNYTLEVSMTQPGPTTPYSGTVSIGYGPARTATIEPDPR